MTRNELIKLWAKVTGKFDALIAGAPEALDTLKEIADKLGDDDDAIAGLLSEVAGKADAPLVISGVSRPGGYVITKRDFDAAITAHNTHRQVYLAEGFNIILIGVYLDAQYKYLLFCGASYDGSPFASVYKYDRDDSTLTDDSQIAGESFGLQKKLTFDSAPTSGSGKLLSSGSVYTALQGKQDTLVSGESIKTVNGVSLLGDGDVTIAAGEDGKSAYQSYIDTTTDSPVKTEAEWVASLKGEDGHDGVSLGEVAIVNNLTEGGSEKVLSAEMGKVLKEGIFEDTLAPHIVWPEVETGPMGSDGTIGGTRVDRARLVDFFKVDGEFTVATTGSGHVFNVFYYTSDDFSSFVRSEERWIDSPFTTSYHGYIRIGIQKLATESPEAVGLSINLGLQYQRRIVDNLSSERTDAALSARQGRALRLVVLGDDDEAVILEQGGISDQDGNNVPASYPVNQRRVRSDYIKVEGDFTITRSSGAFGLFLYDENKNYLYQKIYLNQETPLRYTDTFNGHIRIILAISYPDGGQACTPSDFTVTKSVIGLVERVNSIEQFVPDVESYGGTYMGETIKLTRNKFKQETYTTLPRALSQAMAIYGDYVVLFTYAASSATAYLYRLSDNTLLATLALPNSTYKRPHCNAVSFGSVFNTSDSILPLMYVSQWDNDSQKGCLVYDITLSSGTYSASLVQAILPTNVNTATRGAGQTDWVVDPTGYLYSIGYLLDNGATVLANNKTMICKFVLPQVSDGTEIVLGDADVIDHFDVPIYIYRQDAIFENGRILMLAGMTGNIDRRLLAIDPVAKQVVSIVSLDYINKEPEGIGIADGKLLIGFNGDNSLYHFAFI